MPVAARNTKGFRLRSLHPGSFSSRNILRPRYASFQRLRQQRFIVCKLLAADLLKLMEEIFHRQLLLLFSGNV